MKIVTAKQTVTVVTAQKPDPVISERLRNTLIMNAGVENLMMNSLDGRLGSGTVEVAYWAWGDGEFIAWGDGEEVEI